jgi:hypothetical protein
MSDVPLSCFRFRGVAEYDEEPCPAADSIRPLYIFRNVTSFNFHVAQPDDCMIKEMVAAWPNLTSLKLGISFGSPTRVTFEGLALLAAKCQNLSELRIHIDGRKTTTLPEDITCGATPNMRLQCISFGRSPIEDINVAEVAMFLARVLPNLRIIEADPIESFIWSPEGTPNRKREEYVNRWREVQARVYEIQASRSERG